MQYLHLNQPRFADAFASALPKTSAINNDSQFINPSRYLDKFKRFEDIKLNAAEQRELRNEIETSAAILQEREIQKRMSMRNEMRWKEFDNRFKTLAYAQSPSPRAQTMLTDGSRAEGLRLREPMNLHYQYVPKPAVEDRSFDFQQTDKSILRLPSIKKIRRNDVVS